MEAVTLFPGDRSLHALAAALVPLLEPGMTETNMLQLEQIGIAEPGAVKRGQLVMVAVKPTGKLALFGLLIRDALAQFGAAQNVVSFRFRRLNVHWRRSLGVPWGGRA